jgi:hypothetical protein
MCRRPPPLGNGHGLRTSRDLGVIEIDDLAAASGMLRGVIAMDPQRPDHRQALT